MPSIKRWFHCSQEINRDPEWRLYVKKFGLGGARFWFEVLAILDRTDNYWDLTKGFDLGLLAASCETKRQIIQGSYEHLKDIDWIRLGLDSDNKLFIYAPNWLEYNKRREDKGSMKDTLRLQVGTYPTPTPTPTPILSSDLQKDLQKEKEKNHKNDSKRKKGAVAPHVNGKIVRLAEKPEDVDDQVWNDFIVQRKAKGFPFTVTALKRTITEAEKVGYSLEEALAACCRRGWRGFEARYVTPKQEEFI